MVEFRKYTIQSSITVRRTKCPLSSQIPCLFSLADHATDRPTCSWHSLILPWLVSFYPVLVTVRSIPGTVNRVAVNSMCGGFAKYTQLYLYNDTLHTILHHTLLNSFTQSKSWDEFLKFFLAPALIIKGFWYKNKPWKMFFKPYYNVSGFTYLRFKKFINNFL